MVSRVVNLALRGLQFLFTLLIMALIGNVIAEAVRGNPSLINYDMFVAVFSMLSLFYLIAVAFNDGFTGHPAIPLTLDVLNTLFFFIGGVAMAAELGVHNCGRLEYVANNHITNGSVDPFKRCRESQASTAFLWFGFLAYLASTVISAFGARGGVNMRMGGIRKGGPSMSQV